MPIGPLFSAILIPMAFKKLYILPFDHRASLARLLGFDAEHLADAEKARMRDAKRVIYEGLLYAIEGGVQKEDAAILVDEEFGAEILKDAAERGIRRIVPTEKSGQEEFAFNYGEGFAEHIEAFRPEFVKALVRYNADADKTMNSRQAERLKALSDYCASHGYAFLLELLAIPTAEQLQSVNNDRLMYDRLLRGTIMVNSIVELRSRGANPAIWKVEGLEDEEMFGRVIEEIKKESAARIVILGRDENRERVIQWITAAARFPEVIGFAVGRTIFEEPIAAWHRGEMAREKASAEIASRFKEFAALFEKNAAAR